MYSLPGAFVINHHKLVASHNRNSSLTVLGARGSKNKVLAGHGPSEGSGGGPSWALPAAGSSGSSPACSHVTPPSAPSPPGLLLHVSVSQPSLPISLFSVFVRSGATQVILDDLILRFLH